jgi:hypothetical protein
VPNNQFDFAVTSAAEVDASRAELEISMWNSGTQPVTAFAIRLHAIYSNGTSWSDVFKTEFFPSLGITGFSSGLTPAAFNVGGIAPGGSHTIHLTYRRPRVGTEVSTIEVHVAAVVFFDRTSLGDPTVIHGIFQDRAIESAEVNRWCTHMTEILDRPVTEPDVRSQRRSNEPDKPLAG